MSADPRDPTELRRTTGGESGVVMIEQERAIQEVTATILVARRFPRSVIVCQDRIEAACTSVELAKIAQYAYPRGNETVTGPSIRLAECIAQNWENFRFGTRELSRGDGYSSMEAFAWDVERNTHAARTFDVPHARYTSKGGLRPLPDDGDPRDVYEVVANSAARRMRACILQLIPKAIQVAACRQCDITMASTEGSPAEQVAKLVEAFAELGIGEDLLEERLGHDLGATIQAEVGLLRKIYTSLRDGFGTPEQYFALGGDDDDQGEGGTGRLEEVRAKLAAGKKKAERRRKAAEKRAKAAEKAAAPKGTHEGPAAGRSSSHKAPGSQKGANQPEGDPEKLTPAAVCETLKAAETVDQVDVALDGARGHGFAGVDLKNIEALAARRRAELEGGQ